MSHFFSPWEFRVKHPTPTWYINENSMRYKKSNLWAIKCSFRFMCQFKCVFSVYVVLKQWHSLLLWLMEFWGSSIRPAKRRDTGEVISTLPSPRGTQFQRTARFSYSVPSHTYSIMPPPTAWKKATFISLNAYATNPHCNSTPNPPWTCANTRHTFQRLR